MKRRRAPFVENLRGGSINTERFWQKVRRGPGCWPWIGKQRIGHYGSALVKVQSARGIAWRWEVASRIAYELTYGNLDADDNVLHECDNPPCCRPDHLHKGDQSTNGLEMVRRGRAWTAKLTPAIVRSIREHYASEPTLTIIALARKHSVAYQTIYMIIRGKTWPFAGGPIANTWKRWGIRTARQPWKIVGRPQVIVKVTTPNRAKLAEADVRVIRADTTSTIQALADRHKISTRQISMIRSGRSWAHVQ